jgi:hypothetical protein
MKDEIEKFMDRVANERVKKLRFDDDVIEINVDNILFEHNDTPIKKRVTPKYKPKFI